MAASPGSVPGIWYSGSSEPIMRFDQSKTMRRSSWGTPSSSAMTSRGSSAEISSTKSAVPRSHTESMMPSAYPMICRSRSRTILGVKPLLTRRRYRVCMVGSMLTIISCCWASWSSSISWKSDVRRAEEKCSQSRFTWTQSS